MDRVFPHAVRRRFGTALYPVSSSGVARSWLPYFEDGHWLCDVAVGRTSPIPRPNMGARPSS